MSDDTENEIRLQFLEEAQEYAKTIEAKLIELASNKSDRIDAILRAAHSIKGGAAMMGFQKLSDLAHRLEDFFKVLKIQPDLIDRDLEQLLLAAVDCLQQVISYNLQGMIVDEQWLASQAYPLFDQLDRLIGSPQAEDERNIGGEDGQDMAALIFETEVEDYLQRLESLLVNPQENDLLPEISSMAQDLGSFGEMLQLNAFAKLCASISQQLADTPEQVVSIAEQALQAWRRSQAIILVGEIQALPTSLNLDAEAQEPDSELFLADFDLTNLDAEVEQLASSAKTLSLPGANNSAEAQEYQESTVRVPTKLLERLNDWFGELTIARNGINIYVERLHSLNKLLERRVQAVEKERIMPVGELPTTQSVEASEAMLQALVQLQEVKDDIELTLEESDRAVSDLNRVAKQLQTSLTQVRMRPFADLVARFPRFIRELCLEYGKNAQLKVIGEQTLIERTILEALNNPLMHLLRNAFDHGIEPVEIRQASGKPEVGLIEIKAVYQGNQTLITVKDDGGGINLEQIRTKAQQLGIDSNISDEKLLSLIFEPGFSTANQVTALSGRGVGMDIVRTNLRQIRGDIKVDTQLGVGTTFTLSVPFTLSVMRVIAIEINSLLLAFPSEAIREVLLFSASQFCEIAGNEAISWEGRIAPLIRLEEWLKVRHLPQKAAESKLLAPEPTVLTIERENEWVGLLVERSWKEQEVAIRQVEPGIEMPTGFSSCAILGDGRVAPLVDVPQLLDWINNFGQSGDRPLETPTRETEGEAKDTILVVDDSINVRRFLSLTLEKAGYRVEQAQDGLSALEKLSAELPIKAVICDLDMPNLDGFGLLARVKSNPAFARLPIAMLTSRSGQKDRQTAMQLGATAYFAKPYNEHELLQTLKQMLHKRS
ncbi:hybrid sensor histidine kinase/response regulator [Aliterella atlantica]|uniref:histidine kinase n=1 Tax=Aliterella atlantica CENA595 TaxID=1618023 RepID=A0A0D8ZWR9_9CYAN|nr:hybrid sensor histidine kinase/response regulator [Aliterella atlantica]KJH73195.1 hypothetical protein UH38_03870 [Aliterella atlantica CENA595]